MQACFGSRHPCASEPVASTAQCPPSPQRSFLCTPSRHLPPNLGRPDTACQPHALATAARWVPELVCDEDDPPLQEQGGKNAEQVAHAEGREETLKVHVLEPRVQRAAQLDHLPGKGAAVRARPALPGPHASRRPQQGCPLAGAKGKGRGKEGPRGLGRPSGGEARASHPTVRLGTAWTEVGEDGSSRGPWPQTAGGSAGNDVPAPPTEFYDC